MKIKNILHYSGVIGIGMYTQFDFWLFLYSKNLCNQLCTFNSWRDLWYACQKLTELVVEVDDEDMLLLWSLSMDW